MNVQEKLVEDMKKAMKAREAGKTRLSVIRMARSALKNAEIERRRPLDDGEAVEVIRRELKQRRESLEEFQRAGRPEAVERIRQEIAILEEYLPAQLGEDQIRARAREVAARVGATGSGDLGRVMGQLMPELRGMADGRLVNQVVREILAEGKQETG